MFEPDQYKYLGNPMLDPKKKNDIISYSTWSNTILTQLSVCNTYYN